MNPKQELQAIYAQVPKLDCKGRCADSCGPIQYSRLERSIMVKASGAAPKPTLPDLTCSHLAEGRCTIYAIRPLLCRLWGVVESMPCPHGCVPERWLTVEEGQTLLKQAITLGGFDRRGQLEVLDRMRQVVG